MRIPLSSKTADMQVISTKIYRELSYKLKPTKSLLANVCITFCSGGHLINCSSPPLLFCYVAVFLTIHAALKNATVVQIISTDNRVQTLF